MVICEKVIIDAGTADANEYLVQYEAEDNNPAGINDKNTTLAYLRNAGHTITTEPHPIVCIGDDPVVSWADLCDIIEPNLGKFISARSPSYFNDPTIGEGFIFGTQYDRGVDTTQIVIGPYRS